MNPALIARRSVEDDLLRAAKDLAAPSGEPREPLPHAEIGEQQRREAARRYKRELKEKGRR